MIVKIKFIIASYVLSGLNPAAAAEFVVHTAGVPCAASPWYVP